MKGVLKMMFIKRILIRSYEKGLADRMVNLL